MNRDTGATGLERRLLLERAPLISDWISSQGTKNDETRMKDDTLTTKLQLRINCEGRQQVGADTFLSKEYSLHVQRTSFQIRLTRKLTLRAPKATEL